MGTTRLRVLLAVLALLLLWFVLARLEVIGSSSDERLSASDKREATAELSAAKPPPSFRPSPCTAQPGVCFKSERPLRHLNRGAATALVARFGLPLRDVTPANCDVPAPIYRGRHLLRAGAACIGVAELDRFVATFSLVSSDSDCRALAELNGTEVQFGVSEVGEVDHRAVAAFSKTFRRMEANANAVARRVTPKSTAGMKDAWPTACR